jgi:tRNA-dihydrouridine synthase A
MLGLFNGLPGARAWRRHLAEEAHKPGAGLEIIAAAVERWRATQEKQRAA